jgi:hypothetical protein
MRHWFVTHKKEIVLFIIVFLMCAISFAVGYLTAHQINRAPIIIEQYSSV